MNRKHRRQNRELAMTSSELAFARQALLQLGGDVEAAGGTVLARNPKTGRPCAVLWHDSGQVATHFEGMKPEDRQVVIDALEQELGPSTPLRLSF